MTKSGEVPKMVKATDYGRTIIVFPGIEVQFDGIFDGMTRSKCIYRTPSGDETKDNL